MFLLLLLCVCGTHVLAKDSVLGVSCSGEVLMEQLASTKADNLEPYIVAYGGNPGDRISCISTRDLSLGNRTRSALIGGGPGKRYAVLSVASSDDTDVDFVVRVFGARQLQSRARRQTEKQTETTTKKPTTTLTNKNAMLVLSSRIGQVIIQLRAMADGLESVQKIFLLFAEPFGNPADSYSFIKSALNMN